MVQNRWAELEEKDAAVIANEFCICRRSAEKYISTTEEEIAALNYRAVCKRKKSVLDEYINIIYKMLYDDVKPEIIFSYVIRAGYTGNLNTLDTRIKRIAKNNFNRRFKINCAYKFDYPKDVSVIKRNDVLRYITTKNPEVKRNETVSKYIAIIKQRYEIVDALENIYNDFHEALMGKDPSRLNVSIRNYENSVVKQFIDGIKEDIAPVINAISSELSSGFVEGNNNKFKLIKRTLYGRANLYTLFKKCYLAFKFGLDNFILPKNIHATPFE